MGSPESDLHHYLKGQEKEDAYDEALEVARGDIADDYTVTIHEDLADRRNNKYPWVWRIIKTRDGKIHEEDGDETLEGAAKRAAACLEGMAESLVEDRAENFNQRDEP